MFCWPFITLSLIISLIIPNHLWPHQPSSSLYSIFTFKNVRKLPPMQTLRHSVCSRSETTQSRPDWSEDGKHSTVSGTLGSCSLHRVLFFEWGTWQTHDGVSCKVAVCWGEHCELCGAWKDHGMGSYFYVIDDILKEQRWDPDTYCIIHPLTPLHAAQRWTVPSCKDLDAFSGS